MKAVSIGLLGIFFFLVTMSNVYTETYDIERFAPAKETIRSPITVENEQETERKVRETVQSVEDRFTISDEITDERLAYIEEIFAAVTKIENETSEADDGEAAQMTHPEKVEQLKQMLSQEITDFISDKTIYQLLEMTADERSLAAKELMPILTNVLEKGVRVENIQTAREEVKQTMEYTDLDNHLVKVLEDLTDFAIVENAFYDPDKTMDARKEAASRVEPVVIRAGEIIVREGQTITNEIYEELRLVGLLNKERSAFPLIGLALLILLIMGVIGHELNVMAKQGQLDKRIVASIFLISILVIGLMKIVSLFTTQVNQLFYVVPVATGVLLIKQLLNERMAIVLTGVYAVLGSMIFNGEISGSLNFAAGIYFFFSQLGAIVFLTNSKDRLAIVKAGVGTSFVNIITILLFLFLSFEKYSWTDLLIQSSYGVTSSLLSAILTIGLLPFFETVLGILTDMKLLALSNPNQPLLRKILTEAPGTYHHSVMVANLSEAACEAIGANGLLARVGAYYHDIGKTRKPQYFIENQMNGNNPHDVLDPRESAEMIISHPYDGAAMLKEHRLPKEIVAIAEQHHGTTLLKYFYHKEQEMNQHTNEANYRYPGPKPRTKEAAIVCICDAVEAAVRSMKQPTEEKIEEIVSSIVNDRLMDGQFNESPLKLNELNRVHAAICEALKGMFHSRIQYPMKEAK